MNLTFRNRRIAGMLTVLPSTVVRFEDEMHNYNFSTAKSLKLKLAMGFDRHRVAREGQCSSDFCIHGLQYLFDKQLLRKDEIDALIFVSQSPDYFMPPTSNVIQGHFGMKRDMICMDINQGCAGFEVALIQAFMLLEQEEIRRVVLLNADVLSPRVSVRDRNSKPLIGDAAAITVVERCADDSLIHANIQMDGTGAFALMIPAGGFRLPSSPETAEMLEDEAGNFRAKDHLVMKGDEVFSFVQREVPPMIEALLAKAGVAKEAVDWFLFHQPNRFMLHKLADKLGVPRDRMPSNIVENFGNASSVTIPTNVCYNLGSRLQTSTANVCFAGFGVGLTWSSILMRIGNMQFCEIIEL